MWAIIVGIYGFCFGVLPEAISRYVYGRFIKEEELDSFLSANLDSYELNEWDTTNRLLFKDGKPSIAQHFMPLGSILSKWHIVGVGGGSIPRWSRWSKLLDIKRRQLIKAKEYVTNEE